MADNSTAAGGTSSLTVLLIVFIVLKLTDNVEWSWFWVLSPLILPLILVGIVLGCLGLWMSLGWFFSVISGARKRKKNDPQNVMRWP